MQEGSHLLYPGIQNYCKKKSNQSTSALFFHPQMHFFILCESSRRDIFTSQQILNKFRMASDKLLLCQLIYQSKGLILLAFPYLHRILIEITGRFLQWIETVTDNNLAENKNLPSVNDKYRFKNCIFTILRENLWLLGVRQQNQGKAAQFC